MTQTDYLHEIYRNINDRMIYGQSVTNVRFPYFGWNLYLTNGGYIGWTHCGSSAGQNTLRDLNFIIREIFRVTPEEFCKNYECKTLHDANAF